jgi:hypothetical protein
MKKIYKLISILILVTLLNSCTDSSTDGEPKIDKEIYKGRVGVELDFFDNKLPDEVFEGEEMNYIIKIENKGVYKVQNSKMVISLEKGFIQTSSTDKCTAQDNIAICNNLVLEGKDFFKDFDDFDIIEIPLKINDLDELRESHESYIYTNFCYDYMGLAFTEICIDTDPHSITVTEKPCEGDKVISMSGGQGGPVVIDRIEPRMFIENDKLKPQFKIFLQNSGSGTVIKKGSVATVCGSSQLNSDTYNSVKLSALEFSNYKLNDFTCIPDELSLRNEEDFIVCTLNNGIDRKSTPTYVTPLKIQIDYGYTQSDSKQIKIKKISPY